jgi:electron transfer flavoprotein alpha subunit
MGVYRNVLVFGEEESGKLSSMTMQLLGIGRKLADDLGQELRLLFMGHPPEGDGVEGYHFGVDKVYAAKHPLLENYMAQSYLQALERIVAEQKPLVMLFGQNDKGMDLAPRLAFRLKTGVTLDCVDLQIDKATKALKQVKPVFGGKAECVYYNENEEPQIVAVRDGVFEPPVYDESRTGEADELKVELDASTLSMRFLEKRTDDSRSLARALLSAKTVVSGGRCMGGEQGFEILKETAEILGGTIAGSRPPVDYGWIPSALQVGLTGRKIAPELYLAVGISGAIQHMAGCLKSKTIVSINIDEEAPIFRFSRYGAVGDFKEVLRGFNEECRKIR